MTTIGLERIGYLCIQGYPNRICGGCTSACNEPVFAYPKTASRTATYENKVAQEGVDRCFCGCKYWENDRCIDCGARIQDVRDA